MKGGIDRRRNNPKVNASGDTAQALAYWIRNPDRFVEFMVLGLSPAEIQANKFGRRLEPESRRILRALVNNNYVVCPAGKGVSKTFTFANAVIWWLYTRHRARVAVTGPKFDQLKNTLWAEINKWVSTARTANCAANPFADQLKWTAERIFHVDNKNDAFGFMLTSKEKENIQGVHSEHTLWIVDEGSNVDNFIYETILGGMNDPECKIVIGGNPTKASGFFYDAAFGRDKHKWHIMHFSSEDSARAMSNKMWYERMQRYPRDSDVFRVNVLGFPPRGNPKAIISLEECIKARDRDNVRPGDYLEFGLDPAAEGDDLCAVAVRQGLVLREIRCFEKTQAQDVVNHTLNLVKEYRAKTGITSKIRIKVDDTGYSQAIRHLLALDTFNNLEVVPCLFGGKGNEEYKDYATIMWYEMRDVINEVSLPNDDELIEELSTRESRYIGQNVTQVEPKRDYKKRLGRSPDRADACILCYAKGPTKIFGKADGEDGGEPAVRAFGIDWKNENLTNLGFDGVLMMDTVNIAALVLNRDLTFTGLAAVYQFIQDRLWIYKEFYQENPVPDRIALNVAHFTQYGKYQDGREPKLLGNELMFRQEGDRRPLADVLRKAGLGVREAYHYDEFGAIALGAKMFKEAKVVMHEELVKSRSEINLWAIKRGTAETEKNGYCKALLLILSEVQRQIKSHEYKPLMKYVSPYSNKPNDYHPAELQTNEIDKGTNAWMSR